jgi:hypothetical protein
LAWKRVLRYRASLPLKPRIEDPGAIYQVMNRADDLKAKIFVNAVDRQ